VRELFKFQNTESKSRPNHDPSPMVVPSRYVFTGAFAGFRQIDTRTQVAIKAALSFVIFDEFRNHDNIGSYVYNA
jgi:hypothetical protein